MRFFLLSPFLLRLPPVVATLLVAVVAFALFFFGAEPKSDANQLVAGAGVTGELGGAGGTGVVGALIYSIE